MKVIIWADHNPAPAGMFSGPNFGEWRISHSGFKYDERPMPEQLRDLAKHITVMLESTAKDIEEMEMEQGEGAA